MFVCGRCGVADPDKFHASIAKRNRANWCKACYREWHRSRYTPSALAPQMTPDRAPVREVVTYRAQRPPEHVLLARTARAGR
jgi:hypothetical protein